MQLYLPSSGHDPWGLALTFTSGFNLDFDLTKQKAYHSTRLDEMNTMVPALGLFNNVCQIYDSKTKPYFWVIQVTG